MASTLIARISRLEQYDSVKKTIIWEDPTVNRWTNVYSHLKTNDNAILVAGDRILIGNVSKINNGVSILINDVKDVKCSNDQFLQLHEIYPELISRVKANFQPFIHSHQINIDKLITDANSNKYVSYYILKSKDKYDEMS